MEKKPLPADEKTIVISKDAVNKAVKTAPFGGLKSKTNTPQKKRILPGMLATGGLLGGSILLSSFQAAQEATPGTESTGETAGKVGAVVSTGLPVSELVADDLSFEEARDLAREEVGSRGLFTHKGTINLTTTEAELEQMTEAEKEALQSDITVEPNVTSGDEIEVDGRIMNIEFPLMDKYMEIVTDKNGHAFTKDIDGNVHELENVTKDPFTNQLIRTDAETGEVTQFNPSVILQNVDEGRIDVSIYPSDVEITDNGEILYVGGEPAEPLVSSGWMIDEAGDWGYDYDGDGMIDLYEDELLTTDEEPSTQETETVTATNEEPVSDNENIQQSTDDYDDDGIRKIKIHETEDGMNIKIKGDHGEKIKLNLDKDSVYNNDPELLSDRIQQIADEAGIEDIRKIKVNETEDGFNIKIKGEDGEKIKMHLSNEELENGYNEDGSGETDLSDSYDEPAQEGSDYEEMP